MTLGQATGRAIQHNFSASPKPG